MARPLIAKHQVEIALLEGADAVAHGCTGKGNDQVRFELTYQALAPHLTVIAPWRSWHIRSREDAIAYAAAHDVPVQATAAKIYSLDGNLWHLSHEGGALEDPWTGASRGRLQPDRLARAGARHARLPDARFRRGLAGQSRWPAPGAAGARAGAQRHRRRARSRPHRSAREPAGWDEEPRRLRDSRRHDSRYRPPRAGASDAGQGDDAAQGRAGADLRRSGL